VILVNQKPLRYRALDVGRPGHHLLLVEVNRKAGPRGGHTTGKLMTEMQFSDLIKAGKHKRR